MKKLKLRYLNSIINRNFGNLERESTPGTISFDDDEGILLTSNHETIQIKAIKGIAPQKLSGFQVAKWLKFDFETSTGEQKTTYLTRRSFYHPSTKKIMKSLSQMVDKK